MTASEAPMFCGRGSQRGGKGIAGLTHEPGDDRRVAGDGSWESINGFAGPAPSAIGEFNTQAAGMSGLHSRKIHYPIHFIPMTSIRAAKKSASCPFVHLNLPACLNSSSFSERRRASP